ncbi:hypothetical protein [Curtobacterium sp. ER1/6]|uniref:hypothetical protein n=1 Tax=Curtobacterium sp. ER1/6 TaxID=1891920 RepID=UPI00166FC304|nr:hypothetical protein [Curtobacterium sp. ER1/6]
MTPLPAASGAPAGLPPARRTIGDLVAWPLAAIATGMWVGVMATVLEGLRDSSFSSATIGRDIGDALQASLIAAILPGSLIGAVFALFFAPAGFAAFGLWQAVRHTQSRPGQRWLVAATVACFCMPALVGSIVENAFDGFDTQGWLIVLLSVAASAAVAAGTAFLRRPCR